MYMQYLINPSGILSYNTTIVHYKNYNTYKAVECSIEY